MISRELDLCVTDACNMNCRYCYAAGRNSGAVPLKFEDMRKAAVAYLKKTLEERKAADKISVSGGEPLTNWGEVSKFVEWAAKNIPRAVKKEIFSNGTLLDPAKAEIIIGSGWKLRMSIDGGKEDQDSIRRIGRGASSFDIVMRNLEKIPKKISSRIEAVPVISRGNAERFYENMVFLLDTGFSMIRPSYSLGEIWGRGDIDILRGELLRTSALLKKSRAAGKRLMKISLKNLGGGFTEFARGNEISLGTDRFFYPSSLLSSSSPARDGNFRRKYRMGNLSSGPDWKKFARLRREAWEKIRETGAELFLGCLLCMFYFAEVNGGDLRRLLRSAERIAETTAECGMGEIFF